MTTKTIVVVNRHKVASNRKHGLDEPVLRVSHGKHGAPWYARRLHIVDADLVYDTAHPLPCARPSG